MVKNQKEIENIRTAAAITDKTFEHILQYLKIGVSECEISEEIRNFMLSQGAEDLAFETVVVSGLRCSLPHGLPSDKKFEYGDLITLDFGCVCHGYCSDMTRTVVLGKVSEKQQKIYNTVKQAMDAALNFIKPGVTCYELDKVARDIIESAGYNDYFPHCLGHGVGKNVHEEPRIYQKSQLNLLENMVITIEPGVYISDFGGVRIEDMVLITKDGYENFYQSPKNLLIL